MNSVTEFWYIYDRLDAVNQHGPYLVLSAAYFLVYHLLFKMNRRRGGFLDSDLIHRSTIFILNNCAAGNFHPMFDYILN